MRLDQPSHRCVILAQHGHHLFRLGGFGKAGEAAQIEEHHSHFAAMAHEGILRVAGNDEFGELRRHEALQARQPLELLHLLRHAMLQRAVPLCELCCLRLELSGLLLHLSWSALMRSIDLTRATSAAWSTGFVRYSSAPASSPATTSCESVFAVTMMIGMNGRDGVVLEPPADLDAVQLRHHDVEQDQVRLRSLVRGRAPRRRRCRDDLVAVRGEASLKIVDVVRVVVRDQDARRRPHAVGSSGIRAARYSRILARSWRGL